MADPTLDQFEELLKQRRANVIPDAVNQAIDNSGQSILATAEQDVAVPGNGNIQLGTLNAPPEFNASQQMMMMANEDIVASQNNLPSGKR